ncbi:MAG: hypothetical protein P8171_14465 [Candidatus Thiodiazotropha sp.]
MALERNAGRMVDDILGGFLLDGPKRSELSTELIQSEGSILFIGEGRQG